MSKPDPFFRNLHRFPIRLRNLTDLRAYCSLVDSYPFDGYVQYREQKIQKDDLIALLSCCPSADFILCVYSENGVSRNRMAELLDRNGLSI